MIISNLNSWHSNNNNNNNNNANHISSAPSNFNTMSTDVNDKSANKQPRTIVFCKIKTPNIFATKFPINSNNNNNNDSRKTKKVVKFDEINTPTPRLTKRVSTESKTVSLEAINNNKSFQSISVTDMYTINSKNSDLTQKQIQKLSLNKAIGKKLVALNRYNSANSFNKLNLKDNLHSPYLTNGGTLIINPFTSNLDMINKSNPNYSSLSSKLANRVYDNTHYNQMNHLEQYPSSSQLVQASKIKEATYDANLKIFEDASTVSLNKIGVLNNNETKKIGILNKSSLLNNKKHEKKATFEDDDTKNYFLNYRLIKSDKENILNNIRLNNEFKKNLKMKAQSAAVRPKFEDDSTNDFTDHKYLESAKYYYIKNWIEEVERCQSIEGKCLETMNKIVFYDD